MFKHYQFNGLSRKHLATADRPSFCLKKTQWTNEFKGKRIFSAPFANVHVYSSKWAGKIPPGSKGAFPELFASCFLVYEFFGRQKLWLLPPFPGHFAFLLPKVLTLFSEKKSKLWGRSTEEGWLGRGGGDSVHLVQGSSSCCRDLVYWDFECLYEGWVLSIQLLGHSWHQNKSCYVETREHWFIFPTGMARVLMNW